jgi:hypothetical protein
MNVSVTQLAIPALGLVLFAAAMAPFQVVVTAFAQPVGAANDQEAIDEIRATRDGYLLAQAALEAGQRDEALEFMNTAYLEHFERVEPYLDQRFSRDYREEVEAAISRDIRRRLRDGAPDADVLAQFPAGLAKLDEVEARLSGQ